jgi:hypothetical protein
MQHQFASSGTQSTTSKAARYSAILYARAEILPLLSEIANPGGVGGRNFA